MNKEFSVTIFIRKRRERGEIDKGSGIDANSEAAWWLGWLCCCAVALLLLR
jgi:hypothetical protein